MQRGAQLGGTMPVGYLPDMFGHVAQMPQILRLAGIDQAVVWRGVPAAIGSHAFAWEAPDGSSVRTEYLPHGYGNGATLLDVPGRISHRLEAVHESLREFFGDDPVLAMYGTDHTEPLPELADLIEESGDGVVLSTLAEYLDRANGQSALPRWTGRAALGRKGQPPDGNDVGAHRSQGGDGAGRAGPDALRRAAPGALRRALAGPPARPGVEQGAGELRARLDLWLLRGRGLRAGARPLRRGRADRGRARAGSRRRNRPRRHARHDRGRQPLPRAPRRARRAERPRPGRVAGRRARAARRLADGSSRGRAQRSARPRRPGAGPRGFGVAPAAPPRARALHAATEWVLDRRAVG